MALLPLAEQVFLAVANTVWVFVDRDHWLCESKTGSISLVGSFISHPKDTGKVG